MQVVAIALEDVVLLDPDLDVEIAARPAVDAGLARFLVGTQLVFSIGWALVVFAAVMSAIQPQLDAISRRRAENGD